MKLRVEFDEDTVLQNLVEQMSVTEIFVRIIKNGGIWNFMRNVYNAVERLGKESDNFSRYIKDGHIKGVIVLLLLDTICKVVTPQESEKEAESR